MSTSAPFDRLMAHVDAGGGVTPDELSQLAAAPDVLRVGMLADAVRRRAHGARVTYVRVALRPFDALVAGTPASGALPDGAREVRLTGAPATLDAALEAVAAAVALAGGRAVSGFSWSDVERLAQGAGLGAGVVATRLRTAGLEALASLPLDQTADLDSALDQLAAAGFANIRLTIDTAPPADRTVLLLRAAALQDRFGCIRALSPLPSTLHPMRPTTGYDDVRCVAIARLAAPQIATVQVDWLRYGPKLAQVALTFGADDVDNVTASDEAPDGRRRGPVEEVRGNIQAAAFEPVERDGRFLPVL